MADAQTVPDYIVVEGPIGVGKTTLSRRLAADLDAMLMLEQVDDNPFLPHFYSRREQMALPTQLHFLLDRVDQIEQMRALTPAGQRVVADYLLAKDFLFASLNLDEAELALYQRLYQRLASQMPQPDLVVYLQAPVSVLLERVAGRGRHFERSMDSTYLARLSDAYANFFHYYEESPLLVVNAGEIDFAGNQYDYQALFDEILSTRSGRRFFNPLPENRL